MGPHGTNLQYPSLPFTVPQLFALVTFFLNQKLFMFICFAHVMISAIKPVRADQIEIQIETTKSNIFPNFREQKIQDQGAAMYSKQTFFPCAFISNFHFNGLQLSLYHW